MTRDEIIKALLTAGVGILTSVIPGLSGLLSIPVLGWFVGWGISWLTGLLYALVARLARYAAIDAQAAGDTKAAQDALDSLKNEISNPSNPANYDLARAKFNSAVAALGRVRLQ